MKPKEMIKTGKTLKYKMIKWDEIGVIGRISNGEGGTFDLHYSIWYISLQ